MLLSVASFFYSAQANTAFSTCLRLGKAQAQI
jgi:hypothetical protein